MDIDKISGFAGKLRENVQKVIVGKSDAIDLAIVALLAKGHILLEDVPGIGKTTMAKALSQSLGCTFKRIQFTPDLMPSDVLGVNFFNQKTLDFEFQAGPIFSNVLLADEINRATPRTQSSLLEAMQERQVTIDGETAPLPNPFLVMATQNPVEMEGTFPLPEAQLDRFMLRIKLGYPTPEEEIGIYTRFEDDTRLPTVQSSTSAEELLTLQTVSTKVRVDKTVQNYIVSIVGATRNHDSITLGASPRSGMALYKAVQVWAAIQGREFATPDDVKTLASPVLSHRMILSTSASLKGITVEQLVHNLLEEVPVPIERKD